LMADFVSGLKIGVKLGNGAFGEVFRGEDPAHGEVAVKILRRETYHDDTTWPLFKARYNAEAKNLAKATHRNGRRQRSHLYGLLPRRIAPNDL
jgi:eukaryotic-like serine/threonine-protein kinase